MKTTSAGDDPVRLITLDWFEIRHDAGRVVGKDPRLNGPGLYMAYVEHYVHGKQCLAYIGLSAKLRQRLWAHQEWISRAQEPRLFAAVVQPPELLRDAESLLIYVHQPIYNGVKKAEPLSGHFLVHNIGDSGSLLPVVDSRYPWYGKGLSVAGRTGSTSFSAPELQQKALTE